MSNQISTIDEVRGALGKMTPQFQAALPKHVDVEKFQRVVLTALQMTPDLLKADRRTLFAAATRAAQIGLLPDGREGAIVAFGGQAQFMPMVAGVMKLVRNSGEISTWSVQSVHENDDFDYELGDNERITHRPAKKGRGELIGAYSIVTMKDGERSREFMNVDEIEAIRKRSRSGNGGPWKTDYSEMAKKTVVRRHSKRLPMSTDLDGAMYDDDDVQMVPGDNAVNDPEPTPKQAKTRPSRLAKVAEQAPAHDEDGVIDMGPNAEPPQENEEDSPI